jgi:hypothetical protein
MNDPAAIIGVDENQNVPPLAETAEVPDEPFSAPPISGVDSDIEMGIDNKTVTMVVLDGIVMGPTVIFLYNFVYNIY